MSLPTPDEIAAARDELERATQDYVAALTTKAELAAAAATFVEIVKTAAGVASSSAGGPSLTSIEAVITALVRKELSTQ